MAGKVKLDGTPVKLDETEVRLDVFLKMFENLKRQFEKVT